ncbi:MAG: BatD family protein [Gammaproteobacteria bacterium]|nr:BatD family protein [Gammaproteobacteria bacterium]
MCRSRLCVTCWLLLLAQATTYCLAETVYLNPARVYPGDISELVIEYDNNIPSLYALDTSVLQADFEIIDVSSRVSRLQEGNEIFHRMQWKIQILPRRTGTLLVPEIRFGDRQTPALTLEVLPPPAELLSSHEVFVTAEASPDNPYVGQQTRISVRLYHNVPLDYGSLSEPAADQTTIYRRRDEVSYEEFRNGKEFQVLQRDFALLARQPGEVILSPASYRGIIRHGEQSVGGAPAIGSRKISRSSNLLKLRVRNPPANFTGSFWLPATRLEISQNWGGDPDKLEAGAALGLTLSIVAHGLPAESLPADLLTLDSDNLRIYADRESRSTRFEGGELIGRLEQRFAVIAVRPGTIKLPDLKLPWWDTNSDNERLASIDGRTISVSDNSLIPEDEPQASQNLHPRPLSNLSGDEGRHWLGLALIASGALFAASLVLRRRISGLLTPLLHRHRIRRRLRRACLANDTKAARAALVEWGRERWPATPITGLHQIGKRIADDELVEQLARLDAALFAPSGSRWQGRRLLSRISALERQAEKPRPVPPVFLPRLYPE